MLKKIYLWRCHILPFILCSAVFLPPAAAHAASALQEHTAAGQNLADSSFWASFTHALQIAQKDFDAEINGLMRHFRADNSAAWWLIGISFLYGLLHAAGPGHGKAVISSYLIANNDTLKRGIILAFLSSLVQAATAIILVGLVFLIFTGKAAQEAATRDLEIIGSALIMLLGLRLVLRKSSVLWRRKGTEPQAQGKTEEMSAQDEHGRQKHGHEHAHEECGCGHEHIASPQKLQTMHWRQALPLVFSVGIRPCTGALVVMSFALMNGLFTLGAAAVLAMSFGTFLVVSALAVLAVNARNLALKFSKQQSGKHRVQTWLEWAAALFIFCSGGLLLIASLY